MRLTLCQPSAKMRHKNSPSKFSQPSLSAYKECATTMYGCAARHFPLTYVLSMLSCRIPMASLDVISWESTTMPGGSSASDLCTPPYRLKHSMPHHSGQGHVPSHPSLSTSSPHYRTINRSVTAASEQPIAESDASFVVCRGVMGFFLNPTTKGPKGLADMGCELLCLSSS